MALIGPRSVQTLQNVSSRARQLMEILGPLQPIQPSKIHSRLLKGADASVYSSQLPTPQPIVALLESNGFSCTVSEQASKAYLRYAVDVRHKLQERMQAAIVSWHQSSVSPDATRLQDQTSTLHQFFSHQYTGLLDQFRDLLIGKLKQVNQRVLLAAQTTSSVQPERRTPFKQVCTDTILFSNATNQRGFCRKLFPFLIESLVRYTTLRPT